MDEFKDMDKIVLQPGEVLLLRPKHPVADQQMQQLQATLKAAKLRAVLIAPDIEMFVGVALTEPDEEPAPSDDDHRATIEDAYDSGRFIQYRALAGGEWIDAHKFMSSHRFDWNKYEYRLGQGELAGATGGVKSSSCRQ
jgi:hypothetical protein